MMNAGFTVCDFVEGLRVGQMDDAGLQVTVLFVRILRRSRCHRSAAAGLVSHLRHFIPDYGEDCLYMTGTGIPCTMLDCGFYARMTSICVCAFVSASVFQWKEFPFFDFINGPSKCSQQGLSQAEGITYLKQNEYVQL